MDEKIQSEFIKSIDQQIEKIRSKSSLKSMEYFYSSAQKMYIRSDSKNPRVGTFCNLVPEELIIASGASPQRICGGFQGTISTSERILPQVFCPLIKSSVGFFMNDMMDDLKMVIVPTTCDGKKKAAEILSEKLPTLIMEVPHTIESPQARELWFKEILTLKSNLQRQLGTRITKKGLKNALMRTNEKRSLLQGLYDLRKAKTPPILGSDALLVAHMSFYDELDSWNAHTKLLIDELVAIEPKSEFLKPRIMLTGSPMILPTWKIPLLLEEEGGIIVMDDLCSGAKTLLRQIKLRSWTMYDMLLGLADHYLMSACPCFVPNDPRITRILNYIDEYKIDGVVYHNLQGCQLYGGEAWRLEKVLRKKEIPMLKLETSYGEGDVKQLKIRTDAFLEMIEAKSEE